jgi:predicted nucleic acid-binding protein
MLYAESSAVLAWLLAEPAGETVAALLRSEPIVASELTLLECDRVLLRLGARGELAPDGVRTRLDELDANASTWGIEPIISAVVRRAREPFPDDTVRSLDAIHLATALIIRASVGDLALLSLDRRIRANAAALGFRVVPD